MARVHALISLSSVVCVNRPVDVQILHVKILQILGLPIMWTNLCLYTLDAHVACLHRLMLAYVRDCGSASHSLKSVCTGLYESTFNSRVSKQWVMEP